MARDRYQPPDIQFADRYAPFDYDRGLTPEQWESLDSGTERIYESASRDPGSTVHWLYRTGPELVSQISRAMNAGDEVRVNQLYNEVNNYFDVNRDELARDYAGLKASGEVTRSIAQFAKAGLDGTLWDDVENGPSATVSRGGENGRIVQRQSLKDFLYDNSPERVEANARKYRDTFNIVSNGETRGTADYIMADRKNPLHGLYSGLLNQYNGFYAEATNSRVAGEARAKAQARASQIQSFVTMLAPIQQQFHDRFSDSPVMETEFWNGYYRTYGDRASPKHMQQMVKSYLDATQGSVSPTEWFRDWESVSSSLTSGMVRQVPKVDGDGRPKRKEDGSIETTAQKIPETATDRMIRDRYMSSLNEVFGDSQRYGAELQFDVTDPDHAAAAKKGYSDYMRLKKSGVDLFGTVDGFDHPGDDLADYVKFNMTGVGDPEAGSGASRVKFLLDVENLSRSSLTPKSQMPSESGAVQTDEVFAPYDESVRKLFLRHAASTLKSTPALRTVDDYVAMLRSDPDSLDAAAKSIADGGAFTGLDLPEDARTELAKMYLGNVTGSHVNGRTYSTREALGLLSGALDMQPDGSTIPSNPATGMQPIAGLVGVNPQGQPLDVNAVFSDSSKAQMLAQTLISEPEKTIAPDLLSGSDAHSQTVKSALQDYGKALRTYSLSQKTDKDARKRDKAEETLAKSLLEDVIPGVSSSVKSPLIGGIKDRYDSTFGYVPQSRESVNQGIDELGKLAYTLRKQGDDQGVASVAMIVLDNLISQESTTTADTALSLRRIGDILDEAGLPAFKYKSDSLFDVGFRNDWTTYLGQYRQMALQQFRHQFPGFVDPLQRVGLVDSDGKVVRGQVLHALQRRNIEKAKELAESRAEEEAKLSEDYGMKVNRRNAFRRVLAKLAPTEAGQAYVNDALSQVAAWTQMQPFGDEMRKSQLAKAADTLRKAYKTGGVFALDKARNAIIDQQLVYYPNPEQAARNGMPGTQRYLYQMVPKSRIPQFMRVMGATSDTDFHFRNLMYKNMYDSDLANAQRIALKSGIEEVTQR